MENQQQTSLETITQGGGSLATRDAIDAITSLDMVMSNPVEADQRESLPHMLYQATSVHRVTWAHVARVLSQIRETRVWETIDDGKYDGNWDAFLHQYTKGQEYSAGWASNIIGYRDWIIKNNDKIKSARPENADNEKPQLPRERTMRFILQYKEAFESHPSLLSMVFWKEQYDHDLLRGEVRERMGENYVASKEASNSKAKMDTDTMAPPNYGRPTFGRKRQDGSEERVFQGAVMMLAERLHGMVTQQGVYTHLDGQQREKFRGYVKDVAGTVLKIDAQQANSAGIAQPAGNDQSAS